MKILLLGSTGLVGSEVLKQCLTNAHINRIIAPTRRPLESHDKLENPVIDFNHLTENPEIWTVDAVICALGTTMKTAGSKEAFRFVDHDIPLEVAKLAKANGCKTYVLNSAMGADINSNFFYNQVKGDLENNLKALNFQSLYFIRPGLIGGEREEFRFGEESAKYFIKLLSAALPKKWQINPASKIANAMINSALESQAGVQIVESSELV